MSEFRGMSEDSILAAIEDGQSFAYIAQRLECARSTLTAWLNADTDRSARVTHARQLAAAAWDEMAESGIQNASDPFELSKAKEMAHHFRWRSSKIAPKQYGDKLDLNHSGRIATERELSDDELGSIATTGSR